MSLLKRWRHEKRDNGRESERALAKRPHGQEFGLTRFRDEIDQLFERAWREFDRVGFGQESWLGPSTLSDFSGWPAVDTAEDENSYTVRIDVPGMDPKDVELEVSGNVLTIRGSRQDEWSDKKRGVIRRERRSGSFLRSLPLPEYVDAEKVDARYENGTLTVTAPKVPGKGPRRVPVTA